MRIFHKKSFRCLLLSLLVAGLGGCSQSLKKHPEASKKVTEAKKTVFPKRPENARNRQDLQSFYRRWKGTPYKYGGLSTNGIDCSGFVFLVYKEVFNFSLPRMTRHQLRFGQRIERSELEIGDLVFFKTGKKVWHVGIYVGNNQFIHASTSKGVITSNLDNQYWTSKYRVARRIKL